MKVLLLISFFAATFLNCAYANSVLITETDTPLQSLPGFFRLSYNSLEMPNHLSSMGLLGTHYYAEITPYLYSGMGLYSSITGTQGGLFVLTLGGGLQHQLLGPLRADAGMDMGGGGGGSSLVGGGLLLRPHVGLYYDAGYARLGIDYSYITFPSGDIHSSQVGATVDLPFDFYYVQPDSTWNGLDLKPLRLPFGKYLIFLRNDAGLILQIYRQRPNTRNTLGEIQDGTIKLLGVKLDHYFTQTTFVWLKASGAFAGISNGYMDALAGIGYHWDIEHGLALVPELGIGAGGGGQVNTGGGILLASQLGLESSLTKQLSVRTSGGYLWSPNGQMGAYTFTCMLLYHLNIGAASAGTGRSNVFDFKIQPWRINIFNQLYLHPQRTFSATTTPINLFVLQIDQLFYPHFFMAYQGAFAYSGSHAGGYATGMVGPGIQTKDTIYKRIRLFGEILLGAGGGGSLQLSGGSLIEPVLGVYYTLTPALNLQCSVGELKALQSGLQTPIVNLGFTIHFGTINQT